MAVNTPKIISPNMHIHSWSTTPPHHQSHKHRSNTLYNQIKTRISTLYKLPEKQILIHKSPQGKPAIFTKKQDSCQRVDHCFISISHTQNLSAWILQKNPCAIDIETICKRKHLPQLMRRLINAINQTHPDTHPFIKYPPKDSLAYPIEDSWLQLHHKEQTLCFYKLWTFTESWCKWHDQTLWQTFQQGLPFPWKSITNLLKCYHIEINNHCYANFYQTQSHMICTLLSTPV